MNRDMQAVKIPTGASTWYKEAQDRKGWYVAYSEGAIEHSVARLLSEKIHRVNKD